MRNEKRNGPQPVEKAKLLRSLSCGLVVKSLLILGLFAGYSVPAAIMLPPASITLTWDPSPSENVIGYKIHYGTASRDYTTTVETPTTTVTISNLVRGTTYYFAATAFDIFGMESDYSAEVSYTPSLTLDPVPPQIALATLPSGQMRISGSAAPNSTHVIQATEDMNTWTDLEIVIANSTGQLEFTDTDSPNFTRRFYRVQQISP